MSSPIILVLAGALVGGVFVAIIAGVGFIAYKAGQS